jgi:hypothetical protein
MYYLRRYVVDFAIPVPLDLEPNRKQLIFTTFYKIV